MGEEDANPPPPIITNPHTNDPENATFVQQVQENPLEYIQNVNARMASLQSQITTLMTSQQQQRQQQQPPSSPSIPTPTLSSLPAPSPLDPQALAAITAAVVAAIRQAPVPAPSTVAPQPQKSEKLPDVDPYDGDMDKLDAWEQSLVQRMHANRDRYPSDEDKIAYAESRLVIGKKAHNLMNQHRVNGLCTLISFADWRSKLRQACGNRFEEEDTRAYLRDTLKQGTMNFEEYYNLFSQKKERSGMEDASLIDAMRSNVNYATQAAAISWRKSDGSKPVTFLDHVQMWSDTDWQLRQIKHRHPRTAPASSTPSSLSGSSSSAPAPSARKSNATTTGASSVKPVTTYASVLPVSASVSAPVSTSPTIVTPLPAGDPMDLSQALALVKGRSLKVDGVRRICDQWQLCYYCKLQHPGFTAINCPNRGRKLTEVRSLVLYNEDEAKANAGKA